MAKKIKVQMGVGVRMQQGITGISAGPGRSARDLGVRCSVAVSPADCVTCQLCYFPGRRCLGCSSLLQAMAKAVFPRGGSLQPLWQNVGRMEPEMHSPSVPF